MRVIRPGKILKGGSSAKQERDKSGVAVREVWDDYRGDKKAKKKKEYQKGAGNRMVPKALLNRADGEAEAAADDLESQTPLPKPSEDFETLEQRLGYSFSDRELLRQALTHRSALGVRERADYERLEFLGDAVFDLAVAHLLSDEHREAREGELSKMRAALVNTQALAEVGKRLEISSYIKLGRGEFSSGGNERPSILADVMEAIMGAIYRDSNYETALETTKTIFGDSLSQVTPHDPKTELQEALHIAGSEPPSYLLELVEGPEHAPTFVTVVLVDGEVVGRGRGATKKSAQQEAASQALTKLGTCLEPVTLAEGQELIIPAALLAPVVQPQTENEEGAEPS